MGSLIEDDMLSAFAVVGPVDTIADALRSRCEGAVDRALPIFMTATDTSKASIAATVLKEFRR